MRIALPACLLLLLCGCSREPDFSERYDAASKELGKTASEIDSELERRAREAEPENSVAPNAQDSGSAADNEA